MSNYFHTALLAFTAFFAVMNPIANMPIFMGLVSDFPEQKKKSIALKACLTAFVIVALFVLIGKQIFELFDITIPAFKIAGGILLFYIGFEMLQSKKSSFQHAMLNAPEGDLDADKSIAVSPLAIPILAGPGTIVTAMNFVTNKDFLTMLIVIAAFALLLLITNICFVLSDTIVKHIGRNIITVVGKIMGLILAVIGTNMVISGIQLIS